MVYSLANAIVEYTQFGVLTQVSQERAAVIPFPTVSICNKYPFKINVNPTMTEIIHSTYMNQTLIKQLADTSKFSSLYELDRHLEYQTRYELIEENFTLSEGVSLELGQETNIVDQTSYMKLPAP